MRRQRLGLVDNWLRHLVDIRSKHASVFDVEADQALQADHLCELNVIEQVANVCQTSMVCDAWERGQELAVHGWIYGLRDGLLRDLGATTSSAEHIAARYADALAQLAIARAVNR
jgi:carbonic anhydrase